MILSTHTKTKMMCCDDVEGDHDDDSKTIDDDPIQEDAEGDLPEDNDGQDDGSTIDDYDGNDKKKVGKLPNSSTLSTTSATVTTLTSISGDSDALVKGKNKKRKQYPTKQYLILVDNDDEGTAGLIKSIDRELPNHGLKIVCARNSRCAKFLTVAYADEVVGLITNMTRPHPKTSEGFGTMDHKAGLKLAKDLRDKGATFPICFYYLSSTLGSEECRDLEPWTATTREEDVLTWIRRIVER